MKRLFKVLAILFTTFVLGVALVACGETSAKQDDQSGTTTTQPGTSDSQQGGQSGTEQSGQSGTEQSGQSGTEQSGQGSEAKKDSVDLSSYHLTKLPDNLKQTSTDLFVYLASDPFILGPVTQGFTAAFKEVGLGKLQTLDANKDANTQQTQIDNYIAGESPKVLIVNAATPNSAEGPIRSAKAANLPIVLFNREMDNEVLQQYSNAWFVGTARRQPGDLQGAFVANQLIKNFKAWDKNHDGVIEYALLFGEPGNPEAIGRTAGAKENTQKVFTELYNQLTPEKQAALGVTNPKQVLKQIGQDINANWAQDQAAQQISSLLTKEKSQWPEVIFANNDGMALGALQALNDQGYNKGFDKQGNIDLSKTILLTGVDGLTDAKQAVAEGKMSMTVLQDGVKLAAVTTQVAVNAMEGKTNAFEGITEQFPGVTIDEGVQKARVPYKAITIAEARKLLGLPAEAQASEFDMPADQSTTAKPAAGTQEQPASGTQEQPAKPAEGTEGQPAAGSSENK